MMMRIDLNESEGRILYGLLQDVSGDIVIRLDRNGFIDQASANFAELGLDLAYGLLPAHITDLVESDYADFVRRHVSAALEGRAHEGWAEFPVIPSPGTGKEGEAHHQRWYALSLRPVLDAEGVLEGALCLMRSVQQLRDLEIELLTRDGIDPDTGLANRKTFCASLQRHLARGGEHMVAVFAIDQINAVRICYGQPAVDELHSALASFLKTLAHSGLELALLDDERFGVLLPNSTLAAARVWSEDVVRTFQELAATAPAKAPRLSVSAGLARVALAVESGLRDAELGLILARAGGGCQVAIAGTRQAA
jgi:GGDEF domain-containing protein